MRAIPTAALITSHVTPRIVAALARIQDIVAADVGRCSRGTPTGRNPFGAVSASGFRAPLTPPRNDGAALFPFDNSAVTR
jgi:hypothetical protein